MDILKVSSLRANVNLDDFTTPFSSCFTFATRKRKQPTKKAATNQKGDSRKPPRKKQKKEGTCTVELLYLQSINSTDTTGLRTCICTICMLNTTA